MIVRDDIKQGTPEWFAIKWGKIGGSRADGLYSKGNGLLMRLVAEHAEPFELDEEGWTSSDMLRGIELEPEARRQLSEYIGQELLTAGWWQSKDHSLLGISPDGFTDDLTVACEIKCPARTKHTTTIINGVIPDDNILQCLHYFVVNPKLEKLYFCSFRPESLKPLFVKFLTRESEIDLGTKSKPVIKTVNEWVDIAHEFTTSLDARIKQEIEFLKF